MRLRRQHHLSRSTTESRQRSLGVFEKRFKGGVITEMELAQSRSEYESTLAQIPQIDLIVNCSALGMRPEDPSPIPGALLSPRHLLYDTTYAAARSKVSTAT